MSGLRQRFYLHARLAKGAHLHGYHILDGEKIIGSKLVRWATRNGPVTEAYQLGGFDGPTFDTARDFLAAYDAARKGAAA